MGMINNQSSTRQRHGLSFLEFVGCLVAMIGGVALGSIYLGIDIKQMAIGVLVQAQVVDAGYFEQSALKAEVLTVAAENTAAAAESNPDAVQAALAAKTEQEPAPRQFTAEETRAATRAFWNTLTECMLVEAHGRLQGEGHTEEWLLYDYLSQRKKGHEQALKDLEALKALGVDERLVEHGEQVAAWHKSGVKLFEHALSMLSDGPGAKLTGPFAQSWQSAATQLRMEEKLVLDRHHAVANYLDREYAEEGPFVPALQQQFTQ